jgi:pyridoxine 4-dehydrogenase
MRASDLRLALGLYRTRLSGALLDAAYEAGVRHIDCAYNYGGFRYLDDLASLRAAERFTISSKVGFFPSDAGTVHTLEPPRLAEAAERTAHALGRGLDVMFLHNPEASLSSDPAEASDQLAAAGRAMARLVDAGIARTWGIASWAPSALLAALGGLEHRPVAVMARVGVSLNANALVASTELADALGLDRQARWGMSPLGGSHAPDVLSAARLTGFIAEPCGNAQAAVRLAFELPPVSTVCVSTSSPDHLRQAVGAVTLPVRAGHVSRYLQLLHERHGG